MNERKEIAVIGLGNPLMQDEGVGVRIVEALTARQDLPPEVELLDMGTAGISLLHEMEGRETLVIVDCALMGLRPGTICRFTSDDVRSRKVLTRLSAHEGDLLNTLSLAKRLEICPPDIVMLGIQPERVEPGQELTETLQSRLGEYVDETMAEVMKRVNVHA